VTDVSLLAADPHTVAPLSSSLLALAVFFALLYYAFHDPGDDGEADTRIADPDAERADPAAPLAGEGFPRSGA